MGRNAIYDRFNASKVGITNRILQQKTKYIASDIANEIKDNLTIWATKKLRIAKIYLIWIYHSK